MSMPGEREAAFIGKIMASATHELRNVLAIVKESAGLIEDIVEASEQSGTPTAERLMRAVGRIRDQVKRGADLITSLNKFAHSLDHAEEEVDLNQAVQQISFLCQRRASQSRQIVEPHPGDENLGIVLSHLRLQMAICAAVECCLEQLPEGGTVTVHARRQDGQLSLEFNGIVEGEAVPLAPTETASWNRLADVLDNLGAAVTTDDAAEGFRLVLEG
jgi:C4-dicarboxylate-specific signal transduction histidine kinase